MSDKPVPNATTTKNVDLKAEDGRLELFAKRGKTTSRKEVELSENRSAEYVNWECGNDILQVKFDR